MDGETNLMKLPISSPVLSMQLQDWTTDELRGLSAVLELSLIKGNPFAIIERGHLYIKTKQATLVPLKLKRAQIHLLNVIKAKWEENKLPIRILVLKARQLGISTLIEAVIYAITAYTENTNSLIIADDQDGSGYIFEMSKLFQEALPAHLRNPEKKSNARELVFAKTHSQIIIDSANNVNAGRKYTFRVVHLSEYAFFRDANTLMAGLSQAIPALPRTIVIKESTANGFNYFRDEWEESKSGKNEYIPVFLPWFWDDDYKMYATGFILGDDSLGHITDDELFIKKLMEKDGVGDINERLMWRRWCIRNNCQNSVEKFRQEYPSTDKEAFLASGECYFDKHVLLDRLERLEEIERQGKRLSFRANIVRTATGAELRPDDKGDFEFFENPNDLNKYPGDYYIAGDASSGSATDWSVLEVRRVEDNKQMAIYRAKCEPAEMYEKAELLGHFFNEAMIAIENDKFGFAVNQMLKNTYGNLYYQENVSTDGAKNKKFGWDTNSKTRPMMLAALEDDIRKHALVINSKVFVSECLTFVRNQETKKVEAEEGTNDDTVITMAINSALRRLHPWKPQKTKAPGIPVATIKKNAGYSF